MSTTQFSKVVPTTTNIYENARQIEAWVREEGMTYVEATSRWLDENGLDETVYHKHIPEPILEKIRMEVVEDNAVRPSAITKASGNLDFL